MVGYGEAIILGFVQGVTEWLPVSSSGHLAIMQHFLGIEQSIAYDVLLHLGSLIVILFVYRKEISELFFGVLKREPRYLKMLLYMIVATIPIAVIGLAFKEVIEKAFSSLLLIGISLVVTSVLLFSTRFRKDHNKDIGLRSSIVIGLFQGVAILPGVSRSGSTISAGLLQGIKREEAARFSFLIFIPAILGASVLELGHLGEVTLPMIVGVAAAVVSGFLTLRFLLAIISKDKFSYFSLYCLAAGLLAIIVSIM